MPANLPAPQGRVLLRQVLVPGPYFILSATRKINPTARPIRAMVNLRFGRVAFGRVARCCVTGASASFESCVSGITGFLRELVNVNRAHNSCARKPCERDGRESVSTAEAQRLHTPVARLIFQLVGQVMEKAVPLKVRGCQMYRESARLFEFHRSPRKI